MLGKIFIGLAFLSCFAQAANEKEGRVLSLFNVVSFPNDECESDTNNRNGTCYTAEECSDHDGESSGECAEGFGVCCVFELECGDTSSQNNTYLVQSSSEDPESPCMYEICRVSSNICRIRLDFTTLTLTGPNTGTTNTGDAPAAIASGQVGQCSTDSFSMSGNGRGGTPVICGSNDNGSHMYVDASDMCHKVNIATGSNTNFNRAWDIRVSQYECGEEAGGPRGCLQYYMGDTGTVQSFNFPTTGMVGSDATHLANQMYTICIRRSENMCVICYTPTTPMGAAAAINQHTFGLSISPVADAAKSGVNTDCTSDYIQIPGGVADTNGAVQDMVASRFCGRFFNSARNLGAQITVCTMQAPFNINVHFDSSEASAGIAANVNDQAFFPGGIVGFQLNYEQSQGNCM